jgi:hypothetical protein
MKTTYKIVLAVVSVIAVAGVLFGLYMYNLKPKDLQKCGHCQIRKQRS